MSDLVLIDEDFCIVFPKIKKPKIWDLFHYLIRWCDSYSNHRLFSLGISHNLTRFNCYFATFLEDVRGIMVFVRKPMHRLEHEDRMIKEFEEFVKKKFKKFHPIIVKDIESMNDFDKIYEETIKNYFNKKEVKKK